MLKLFLYSILIFIVLNFTYKGIRYIVYDKTEGKVIRHDEVKLKYSQKQRYSKKKVMHQKNILAPIVSCNIDNEQISFPVAELEIIELLDDGDSVIVLYDKGRQEYKAGTFFNFWLTIYDMGFGLFLSIMAPVAYEIFKELKK